jgi:ATP-binding cassette subfamily A (ABC1) protein 3
MTGVNPIIYWGSAFVWDFFLFVVIAATITICFKIFTSYNIYTVHGGGGVIFLILLVYGYAAIPFSYCCSLIVGTVAGGYSLVAIIHILTGLTYLKLKEIFACICRRISLVWQG